MGFGQVVGGNCARRGRHVVNGPTGSEGGNMKYVAVVMAVLAIGVAAFGNPYAAPNPMDQVIAMRDAFNVLPKQSLTQGDLPLLELFLTERQLTELWTALAAYGEDGMIYRDQVEEVKWIGEVTVLRILIFFDLPEKPEGS